MRQDYRNFRIDRITQINVTPISFQQEHPSLKSYLSQISTEEKLHTIIIKIEKSAVKLMGDEKYYRGFVSQKIVDEKVEMTFLTSSIMGFARWFLFLGDMAEIISPDILRDKLKEIAEGVLKRMS